MKKEYYLSWTIDPYKLESLSKALNMCQSYKVKEVSIHCNVPSTVIERALREQGLQEWLPDQNKVPLFPEEYYDTLLPELENFETNDERRLRVQEAMDSYRLNCNHTHFHVRCSRCQTIIGSEVTHVLKNQYIEPNIVKI